MSKKKSSNSCLGVMVKMTILLVILAAITIGGGIFLYEKLNEFFNRSGGNVIVPDFRGKHTSEVMKLKPADITLFIANQKFDDRQPKDYVIAQYPEPGTLVKPGKQVQITVSLGLQKVSVPNLIGKSMREVNVELMNSQLILGNSAYIFSDEILPDRIVGQSPLSSEEYGVNKNVDLLISLGKKNETLPLPNLIGTNLDSAKTKIRSWGFNVGRIYSKPDANRQKYQIISTNPSPYSYLRKGEIVNLLVSSGSDSGTATAEDINRFEFPEIHKPISTPKFSFEENKSVATTNSTNNTSSSNTTTNKESKTETRKAETETPKVENKPQEKVTEITAEPVEKKVIAEPVAPKPAPVSKPTKEVTFVMPDGFMPKEVKFIHIKPDGREQLYSGTHKPLDSIKVKVPIVPNSKLQIYINDVPVEERKVD